MPAENHVNGVKNRSVLVLCLGEEFEGDDQLNQIELLPPRNRLIKTGHSMGRLRDTPTAKLY
jgi:hypothetical protein